jgi:hypothetical protein
MAITQTSTIHTSSDDICQGPNHELMVKRGVVVLGDTGGQHVVSPARYASVFEDFDGATVALSATIPAGPGVWRSRKGSDGQAVDWTITDGVVGGVAVGTIGDTTASMAVSGVQLDSGLNWKPNQGELILEARVKMSQVTTISVFIGFTDQVAALEMPIHSAASANTITTNATDGVGFMFDTSMTADTWWLVGVANNTDATAQNTALVPVADTYAVFRIELSTAGVATFYYNGTAVGTAMTGATTATVALTPVVAGFNRDTTGTPTLTVDYIAVQGLRA